ncbi:MAG: glycine cleavage system protein GcvH [Candidatus Tectomicrobia bacterium]|uniref:Glycine cleavage system H protein n=1 Tax=Tectimicrobiota bacterium TaxID=2528274 RepID=A0A933LQM2_UNCTE|nr:glycine cleavage system protein GcvH [Candidatus Tectomicrobia bacterium]
MKFPVDLKYSKEHEWIRVEQNIAIIGITDYAQKELGEVVFVDLPKIGRLLKAHETFGIVESVKAVSDLFCPVTGKIVKNNANLDENPELINTDPYGEAWIIQVEMSNPTELNNLLSAQEYEAYVAEEKK